MLFGIGKVLSINENNKDQFQFVELFRSNDTERVRAVTNRTAPSTHCQRRPAAKFQFVEQMTEASKEED